MSDAEDMRNRRPAEPPSEAIGSLLRARREAMGLSAAQAAKALRIRQVFIDALEEGRTESLPGSAYAFGFVRSYARLVGMDDERAVQQFKDEAKGIAAPIPLVLPKALTESRAPGFSALVIGTILLAAAYGAWSLWGDQPVAVRPSVSPPPPIATPAPPPPAIALPAPEMLAVPPAPAEATTPQPMPAAPPAVALPAPPEALTVPEPPLQPVPAAAPAPPALAAPPVPAGPQYLVRASQASWVEIRAGDGRVLVSRVLAPGDVAVIPADPRARMVTGNAGGVVIEAEGTVSEPLGRIGQVIRDIPLEPAARAAFFATPRQTTTAPPPPPGE